MKRWRGELTRSVLLQLVAQNASVDYGVLTYGSNHRPFEGNESLRSSVFKLGFIFTLAAILSEQFHC